MRALFRIAPGLLGALLLLSPAHGEGDTRQNAGDGDFDTSEFLLNRGGVFPVPAIITEPAVGFGGGLMLLHFSEPASGSKTEGRSTPPNVTGVGGFGTENGSRGGGLFHFHTWDEDRYRYLGAFANGQFNLDYYGASSHGRSYEIKGSILLQQLLARVGDTAWFVGPRYTYAHSQAHFSDGPASELPQSAFSNNIGKLGLIVEYDTRDNLFYPTRGTYAGFEAHFARDWVGSDASFETYRARDYTWIPLAEKWTLGVRGDGQFSRGDIPFYAQPYVDLRGVSGGRYQDQNVLTGEVELRWNITPRWSLLGFSGIGKAYGNWNSFSDATNVASIGAGFRYLVASKLGLAVGVDIAHSRGQNAIYIQVGSAWR